ncbi:MAG: DUF3536 domain-containing protein [Planctomycetota bacterium]|jgi:hypothetical protein|nr:DUF3536 domain-containing protein [Planctomycetota bacterium]
MLSGRYYLMVHGHFYQPPRENPWTGVIEEQVSAAPWPDWNQRIAAECYLPMARSALRDADNAISDLYNNYAHTSFNYGPTLLSWLDRYKPSVIRHLKDALELNRTSGLAQVYSHLMLPLADTRDRHTQIVWGLEEFNWRFGFYPDGMWLSECGIDRESVRTLIDHRVRFVILSPHQASKARPFGEVDWRESSMGSVDTRRAYRLFDIDGGGRTHFDRFLDVIFYTPGLNLKVSFDHILNRPDDLQRELLACYEQDRVEAQLVSIVTDGEIYGHHEKNGQEALSHLFSQIAPAVGLTVCSAGEFIRDNPPTWEIKLWDGDDARGSSWSCQHGMGRWYRDCGCSPRRDDFWNQAWRTPLRRALDELRGKIRQVTHPELGKYLLDVDEARDAYIAVVLAPGEESRQRFISRFARRTLDPDEKGVVWRLLEAERHAMLMYTSCGWFFDELSGLEPVQNMRYALRAAELVQPFHPEDLAAGLEARLASARSNLTTFQNGGEVFSRLALTSSYSDQELTAGIAIAIATELPHTSLAWQVLASRRVERQTAEGHFVWGDLVCHDQILDRRLESRWLVNFSDPERPVVALEDFATWPADTPWEPSPTFAAWSGENARASAPELAERINRGTIPATRLPSAIRRMLYRRFLSPRENDFLSQTDSLASTACELLRQARNNATEPPEMVLRAVIYQVEREMEKRVNQAIATLSFSAESLKELAAPRRLASEFAFTPSLVIPARSLALTIQEMLYWLERLPEAGWLAAKKTRLTTDGRPWMAPLAPLNQGLAYPEASLFALALGLALAKWRESLLALPSGELAPDKTLGRVVEILDFAVKAGFVLPTDIHLPAAFWDLLVSPFVLALPREPEGNLPEPTLSLFRQAARRLDFTLGPVEQRLRRQLGLGPA